MSTLEITNHGPLITATNYWESAAAEAGKIIVSPNAGVIRCLIPPSLYPTLGELRAARHAVVSLGPWEGREAVEIMWEDDSDAPHAWHITADACVMVPGDPSPDQWVIACWVQKKGKPHKALERPAYWRRVPRLPCLQAVD